MTTGRVLAICRRRRRSGLHRRFGVIVVWGRRRCRRRRRRSSSAWSLLWTRCVPRIQPNIGRTIGRTTATIVIITTLCAIVFVGFGGGGWGRTIMMIIWCPIWWGNIRQTLLWPIVSTTRKVTVIIWVGFGQILLGAVYVSIGSSVRTAQMSIRGMGWGYGMWGGRGMYKAPTVHATLCGSMQHSIDVQVGERFRHKLTSWSICALLSSNEKQN